MITFSYIPRLILGYRANIAQEPFTNINLHEVLTYRDKLMYVFTRMALLLSYVDNYMIFFKQNTEFKNHVISSRMLDSLEEKEIVKEYLGILIELNCNTFKLSQPHLIKQIIVIILGIDCANPVNYLTFPLVIGTKDEGGETTHS